MRRRSRLRDYPAVLWLIAAVVVAVIHRQVPSSGWLLVHLVLLGALSHSILVWSLYFAQAILRVPLGDSAYRGQNARLTLLFGGTLAVLLGYPTGWWWMVAGGATLAVAAVLWHGVTLWRMLRRSLTARFRITIRYYIAAASWLAVGATLGVLLGREPADPWHGQLLLAHSMANLLGWVGLTVTGTLITFWPTLLRTRMDDRAARLAGQALPVLLAGLATLVVGGLTGLRPLALAGLALYALGLLWWARALWLPLRAKPPREFSAASVGCALVWGMAGIIWVGTLLATASGWGDVSAGYSPVAAVFAAGFAAQLLFGALSHLVPTVLGGGPRAVRAAVDRLNRWTTVRLVVVNGGLLLYLLPVPSWVRVMVSATVLAGLAVFIPLLFNAIRASITVRKAAASAPAPGNAPGVPTPRAAPVTGAGRSPVESKPSVWTFGQLIAGLTVLCVAVSVGVGLDPSAAGISTGTTRDSGSAGTGQAASDVEPTGETVRVDVSARDMAFFPDRVSVDAGDSLLITVSNDDASNTHDLSVGGETTPRVAPGESAELDLGVVDGPLDGNCTIAGHAAMGMVFAVDIEGEPEGGSAPAGGDPAGSLGTRPREAMGRRRSYHPTPGRPCRTMSTPCCPRSPTSGCAR